jgi:TLC domain
MDFFTEFYVPQLETMSSGILTQPVQSILFETIVWTIIFLVFCQLGGKHLRGLYRNFEFWKLSKSRSGIFMKNGQDDTVFLTVVGFHHATAGGMMLYGYLTGSPTWFRHGYLWEAGFEIGDLLSMALQIYPHRPLDNMKEEMRPAMIFHHIPGIFLALPIFVLELHNNENLQAIAIALLVGAAISTVIAQKMYTLKVDTQSEIKYSTFLFAVNVAFFFYCRWYVFPVHSYLLIQDVEKTDMGKTILLKMLYACGGIFSLFNVAITADLVPKLIRYTKRCLDGVTPLEDGKVPSTRDSLVVKSYAEGTYGGRRSSVMNIISSRNRSSMANMIGMVSLESLGLIDEDIDDTEGSESDENNVQKESKKVA